MCLWVKFYSFCLLAIKPTLKNKKPQQTSGQTPECYFCEFFSFWKNQGLLSLLLCRRWTFYFINDVETSGRQMEKIKLDPNLTPHIWVNSRWVREPKVENEVKPVPEDNMDEFRQGLPWWPGGKESACNAGGALGSISESGRSPGGGHGNPFQYSCLENPMDREACQAIAHGVAELDTTQRPNDSNIESFRNV